MLTAAAPANECLDIVGAEIGLENRHPAGLITEESHTTYLKLTGPDHEGRIVQNTAKIFFGFDDVAYANRFAKAFAQAVELCGGKSSPF
jgi:hypothetical protein